MVFIIQNPLVDKGNLDVYHFIQMIYIKIQHKTQLDQQIGWHLRGRSQGPGQRLTVYSQPN